MVKRFSLILAVVLALVATQADAFMLLGRRMAFTGNDTYTKLLLHFDGTDASTTISDSSLAAHGNASVEGDAQLDTAQYKLGTASLLLDGTGDYIHYADSADWYFSGNFTIDFWVRFTALPPNSAPVHTYAGLCGQYQNDANNWGLTIHNSGSGALSLYLVSYSSGTPTIAEASVSLSINTWYHVAIAKTGSTVKMFLNGNALTVSGSLTFANVAGALHIGHSCTHSGSDYYHNGHIDEFRISNGVARWEAAFTSPTQAYR